MRFALRTVCFALFAFTSLATVCADDMLTQTGVFLCSPNGARWSCPAVTFPRPFGGIPTVTVSLVGFNSNSLGGISSIDVQAGGVTPIGFQPFMGTNANFFTPARISWVAVGPNLLKGPAVPNYLVLTVIYAPPGTNGGHSTSSVSYQSGSSTGTTTSASQTFKTDNTLSFDASGGFLGNGGGTGVSFEYSHSTTDTRSLDIKKSATATIAQGGPAQDGINHDEDEIWLLLNPTVNLSLSSSSAAWIFGDTPSRIQYLHVGWLNGHQTMPPGVATELQNAGITPTNYPDILARDPFANGSNTVDPRRFLSINTTFPYEPPLNANDPVPTVTFNISDSSTSTVGSEVDDTYKVGVNQSFTGSYLDFFKATMKDTLTWEWTNKTSASHATGTSESASLTVGGPSYGYTGQTVVQVYFDTMYKTFAFVLTPVLAHEISVDGTLLSNSGKPLPSIEVALLDENGVKHRTFTNSKGKFKFFGHITGPATLEAAGNSQVVSQPPTTTRHVQIREP